MNLKTKSLYPFANQLYPVDIFGYCSHGVPGLEIIGLGKHARSIKEKFIFLSRSKQLKLPKRRFVICIEGDLENKKFVDEEYRFLELPMLLIFWALSGHLPFTRLDNCFSAGRIGIDGTIHNFILSEEIQHQLTYLLSIPENASLKIIAPRETQIIDEFNHLLLEEILP